MVALERIGLLAISALATINLWTGGPLLAVWIGSRVQGDTTQIKMSSLVTIIVVLGLISFALLKVLTMARHRYDVITGVENKKRQAPWMRSMRGEREADARGSRPANAVDKIVMAGVVLAVIAFEIWFFFFSGSSLPNQ